MRPEQIQTVSLKGKKNKKAFNKGPGLKRFFLPVKHFTLCLLKDKKQNCLLLGFDRWIVSGLLRSAG